MRIGDKNYRLWIGAVVLVGIMSIIYGSLAEAKTAWYYDPDRNGDGIILSEIADGRIAFALYAQTYEVHDGAPIVSPPPPEPLYCDRWNIWFTGLSQGLTDGFAYGKVFYNIEVDSYPEPDADGDVSKSVVVGDFILWREGGGFKLYMENNYTMCNLSVFGVEHDFTTKLTE